MAVTFCSINHVVCDVDHDALQFCINFFEGPGQTLGVLGHLECGCCNTTCVCSFSRCEDYAVLLQIFGCFQSSRHVSALAYCSASVLNKCFCILKQQLVLSCARKSKVCFYNPYAASFVVLGVWTIFLVLGQTSTIYFFDLF